MHTKWNLLRMMVDESSVSHQSLLTRAHFNTTAVRLCDPRREVGFLSTWQVPQNVVDVGWSRGMT